MGAAEEGAVADGVSVSTTVTGCGVLESAGTVVRLVTVPCDGGAGVSVSTAVLSWIWLSAAARKRVVIEACAACVAMTVVGRPVDAPPGLTDPTIGSQAPLPMGRPSCWTTVGCELR